MIQKLNDDGVPAHQIVQISGHKIINSINNYCKINNEQSKQISDILSNNKKHTSSAVATLPCASAAISSPYTMQQGQQSGFFVNPQFHGNVTFNFQTNQTKQMELTQTHVVRSPEIRHLPSHSPSPPRKFKRIRMILDSSDSDN